MDIKLIHKDNILYNISHRLSLKDLKALSESCKYFNELLKVYLLPIFIMRKRKVFAPGYDINRCPCETKEGWRCRNIGICAIHTFEHSRCSAIKTSGKYKGNSCGNFIAYKYLGYDFCGIHKKNKNPFDDKEYCQHKLKSGKRKGKKCGLYLCKNHVKKINTVCHTKPCN